MNTIFCRLVTPLKYILPLYVILCLNSCKETNSNNTYSASSDEGPLRGHIAAIKTPGVNEVFTCGDTIKIILSVKKKNIIIDSVYYFINNSLIKTKTTGAETVEWNSKNAKVGQNTVKTVIYFNDTLKESHSVSFVLLSDITPVTFHYKVINKYPHDESAYTQGLAYDDGYLYEGTGKQGQSSLRKVDIKSGVPVKKLDLDQHIFGEGIVIINDYIYQITYKTQIGFIYDKETLDLIRKFDYQIREGWGLATDGKKIFMSDGSSNIYIIDCEYFTQTGQIEVFDNKGIVSNLNELEYINGKIFANIYGDTRIVIIDPCTGKVTGKLDLAQLMPPGSRDNLDKVLNGIAYNNDNNHLYITGKYWPVLYEIEITDL
jgi:glutamine cyclotransferase